MKPINLETLVGKEVLSVEQHNPLYPEPHYVKFITEDGEYILTCVGKSFSFEPGLMNITFSQGNVLDLKGKVVSFVDRKEWSENNISYALTKIKTNECNVNILWEGRYKLGNKPTVDFYQIAKRSNS